MTNVKYGLNERLLKVLRVLKSDKTTSQTSYTELARLAQLSRQTINKHQTAIQHYLSDAPPPSNLDLMYVRRRQKETYVEYATAHLKLGDELFPAILGAIAGYQLRHEVKLISHLNKIDAIIELGKAFVQVANQVQIKKDNSGIVINSQNKAVKHLLNSGTKVAFVDKLFSRSKSYSSARYSKKWKLTKLGQETIQEIVKLALHEIRRINADLCSQLTVSPLHRACK
ncbi:hypothetical protein [Thiosulfativibrio zosterae]|uniref:Uncharacterized protein n=1 Tax=Thiosulfativibrio zosterae TaxID=2675053 RepID=A0A6F8PQJ0_9GAMM|nr:hypothetical protein [Thiosulfativibrio zosterae]BBP44297.1 hypothetical protein THMIRHAT_20430 [Thiosulfativibrio zosterae]